MEECNMEGIKGILLAHIIAIEEEKQETCIHCGSVWYSMHYRDGVCYRCRQSGKLGRAGLAAEKRNRQCALIIAAAFFLLYIILHV
jgi:hypothetical protein